MERTLGPLGSGDPTCRWSHPQGSDLQPTSELCAKVVAVRMGVWPDAWFRANRFAGLSAPPPMAWGGSGLAGLEVMPLRWPESLLGAWGKGFSYSCFPGLVRGPRAWGSTAGRAPMEGHVGSPERDSRQLLSREPAGTGDPKAPVEGLLGLRWPGLYKSFSFFILG